MSTSHSTPSSTSLSTANTKISDRSHPPSAEHSSCSTTDYTACNSGPDVHTRRATFKEKCQNMRASELTPDTASQNSSSSRFSDEETILCELTDYAQRNTERGKHGPEVIAQKLEQTKPSRGCMGSSFANIYVSGSTYGRKTIGSGSGAPAGCATM